MATNPGKTNLIAWWELNETSGTRVDSHGTNDLTDNNTVGYAAGKKGNAADFEAANNEYLSIADNADLSFGDEDMSVCAWVKLESKPANGMQAIQKGDSTIVGLEWSLNWLDTTDRFRASVSNGSSSGQVQANSLGTPILGTWYFLAMQHDSVNNLVKLSVNAGTFDTVAHTIGIQDGNSATNLGRNPVGANRYWDGLIDEVSIWSKVLSQEEIDWLYNGGMGRSYAELSNPSPTAIALAAPVLTPGIGLYDTRIKLRARARDVHLTTKVRNLR